MEASNNAGGKPIQKSVLINVVLPTSTPVPPTEVPPATPIPPTEIQPPGPTSITFERFPDGRRIRTSRILRGDEFLSKGIRLAGAPDPGYCDDAVPAIHVSGTSVNTGFNFLTTASPGQIVYCNTVPIAITFVNPVREVSLTFFGAAVTYTMKAYDNGGGLLGTVPQAGEDSIHIITFTSGNPNIARVTFGHTAAVTVIKEIVYQP